MTVSVRFPSLWRSLLGRREVQMSSEGQVLREILTQLLVALPELRSEMVDEQGNLQRHLLFFINDQNVALLGGMDTPVRDGDRIVILLAAAGGGPMSPGPGSPEQPFTERRLLS